MGSSVYSVKTFCSKVTKRQLEQERVYYITSQKGKGNVASLCGPAVKEHIETLKPLLNKNSKLLFAEWDKKVCQYNGMKRQVREAKDDRISLYIGNIWDMIKKERKRVFLFLDLDFCLTVDTLIAQGLQNELKKIAYSKLPKRTGFFISLTMCQRGDKGGEYLKFAAKVQEIFYTAGWSIRYADLRPYREQDNKGTVMVNTFIHVRMDYNNKRKRRN